MRMLPLLRSWALPVSISFAIWYVSSIANADTAPYKFSLLFSPGYLPGTDSLGYAGARGQQVVGYVGSATSPTMAALWSGTTVPVDLNPPDTIIAFANATNGAQQVGKVWRLGSDSDYHATLWNGTANSAIDLNPVGFTTSTATDTDGRHQVGSGFGPQTGGSTHALLWSGTNAATDLNPTNLSGFTSSEADGVLGDEQVGYGSGPGTAGQQHALLWNGRANTATDLHPVRLSYIASSSAAGIGGNQQVGTGIDGNGQSHALLWRGTNNAVDLNPAEFTSSLAVATNGFQQVGLGYDSADAQVHAIVWTGTAGSAVDLEQFLPSDYVSSRAAWIDAAGNVFGFAFARDRAGVDDYVEWIAVPEPLSPSGVAIILCTLVRRRAATPPVTKVACCKHRQAKRLRSY